jgi:hypothetical protein
MNRSTAFLRAYEATGSISKAAEAAGIDRTQHYRRLKQDKNYAQAFAESTELAINVLEEEALRRAVYGVDEPVVFKGRFSYDKVRGKDGRLKRSSEPLAIRKYSDSLLQFLLRGARPEKYRERYEHTGPAGGPIENKLEVVFVERIERDG